MRWFDPAAGGERFVVPSIEIRSDNRLRLFSSREISIQIVGGIIDRFIFHAIMIADQVGADAGGLVDRREAGTGMGSASDEVAVFKTLILVVRPEIQHLAEVVRQVERSAHEDSVLLPIRGGEDFLLNNVVAEIFHRGLLFDPSDDFVSVFLFERIPILIVTAVDRRDENVEGGVPFRRDMRVGDR